MTDTPDLDAVVIGAGPAGLMAAEALADAGRSVLVVDAKPSPARKLLMAGKSGLNLTKSEPLNAFLAHYGNAALPLTPMLTAFGPAEIQAWAQGLGQELFTGSTGRVFPKSMKASPLLRAWLARLAGKGVTLQTRTRWTGWAQGGCQMATPDGTVILHPRVTVLACGGASWARLGSDGAWASWINAETSPFEPSNAALSVTWSTHMTRHMGQPLKNIALTAGDMTSRGEITLSSNGIEGGGIYPLTPALRRGAPLHIDLLPDQPLDSIRQRLSRPKGKTTIANHLRKTLRLDPVKLALLMECARPLPDDLAPVIKHLPVPHNGPRPMDESISTAGGLSLDALDQNLMLKSRPGTFAAGEMLDWDAPTGGYLLTACMATGLWAGQHAARWQPK